MPAKTRASTGKRRSTKKRRPPKPSAKALRTNPFVPFLSDVRKDVDTRLAGLLDSKVDGAAQFGSEVVEMVRAFRDLCLRGGKRMRAALVVAGFRAADATADLEPALDAAVAIELLHAYFLVHDDWMDGDDVRRGGPSVHALLQRRFESKKLGDSSAVLAGDYGVALAMEALCRVDVPTSRLPRVFAAFAQMQTDAIAGQQLDITGRGGDVEKTYVLKTGSYTVAGPLRVGALLAGGSDELILGLERFALPAGVAFQLRDDLLSVFGDPKETGKPFANDIRSGKRTVLVEEAFRLATAKDKSVLMKAWGNSSAKEAALRAAVGVLETSGARRVVEDRIQELTARALEALAAAPLPETRHRLLRGAVEALTDRRS
jgi:geranylgeranyl diphosphate synthase type I